MREYTIDHQIVVPAAPFETWLVWGSVAWAKIALGTDFSVQRMRGSLGAVGEVVICTPHAAPSWQVVITTTASVPGALLQTMNEGKQTGTDETTFTACDGGTRIRLTIDHVLHTRLPIPNSVAGWQMRRTMRKFHRIAADLEAWQKLLDEAYAEWQRV